VDALDAAPFLSDYGSWYDRAKVLVEGDSDTVAKVLEIRRDLSEENLGRCLLSARKCLETLLEEKICRNPPHASTRAEYVQEVSMFLEKLFDEREKLRTRALFANRQAYEMHFHDIFLREYARYEKYLYDDAVFDSLICPLQNLTVSKDIELQKRLLIRRITQEEFQSLVEAERRGGYELVSYPEFLLCLPVDENDWRECIENAITSLRLLRKERVGLVRIYYAYGLPFRPWKILDAPAGTKFVQTRTGGLFNIDYSREEVLRSGYLHLDRVKEAGYLAVAIRRFNFAQDRERIEDSWIDYFVSLESLYSKSSESTEVTHRLATRVSKALVSNSMEDRKKKRETTKRWYRLRSEIIHGNKVDLNEDLLQDLEELVRESLNWFLNHTKYANHDEIIDMLDLT
jgi:hypothetical protein